MKAWTRTFLTILSLTSAIPNSAFAQTSVGPQTKRERIEDHQQREQNFQKTDGHRRYVDVRRTKEREMKLASAAAQNRDPHRPMLPLARQPVVSQRPFNKEQGQRLEREEWKRKQMAQAKAERYGNKGLNRPYPAPEVR